MKANARFVGHVPGFRRARGIAFLLLLNLIAGAISTFASEDYGPAIWRPCYSTHKYTSGYGHRFHVVHDMEGYYLSTISYFQRSTTQASVHYFTNGKKDYASDANPGEVSQGVRDAYYGWHARCWNQYSTGTEHEGFVSNPAWYTEAQYVASAGITKHVKNKFGWAMDRNHVIGHDQKRISSWRTWMSGQGYSSSFQTCNDHTDPGAYWNWSHYMDLCGNTISTPSGPSSLNATAASTSQINLSWTDNSGIESGFKIERGSSSTGPWSQIATVGANVKTFSNTDLSAGTTYYYRVRAYNAAGNSPYSNVDGATTTSPANSSTVVSISAPSTVAPGQSFSATVVMNNNGTKAWTSDSTPHRLGSQNPQDNTRWGLSRVGLAAQVNAGQNATFTFTATAPTTAGSFAFDWQMVEDSVQWFGATATKTITVALPIPAAPSGLTATAVSGSQINLTWVDNSSNEDGFRVERATAAAGPWTQIVAHSPNVTSSQNTGLSATTTYYYRVRAYNAGGNSTYSSVASATTQNPPPVLAAIGNKSVNETTLLTFTAAATDPNSTVTTTTWQTFEAYTNNTPSEYVMFKKPANSATTSGFLDTAATNYTRVVTNGPTGNGSAKVLKAGWTFLSGQTSPWLRLTTFNAASVPNPTIDLNQVLRFKIYTTQSLRVGIGVRETGTSAAIGGDGGTAGTIEWVGTPSLSSGRPVPSRIVAANTWTTLTFNIPFEAVSTFTGDGVVALGKGTLEHLTLSANGNSGAFTVYLDDFAVVNQNTLTYSLDAGAPAGATIHPKTGVFKWTPTAAQGPAVYNITVRVTDNASPTASDFETISVAVLDPNSSNAPPVLAAIGNKTATEGIPLSFTATATDSDSSQLTFSLDSGAPTGASISAAGVFSWTPNESHGGGSFPITIRVTDNGSPNKDDFETISVAVNEANSAPVMTAIPNKIVDEGSALTFAASATDSDVPVNSISYSLDSGAPEGATIDSVTGAFSWTPTETQGPGTYSITVRATDNGSPVLSGATSFDVTVNEVNIAPVLTLETTGTVGTEIANFEDFLDGSFNGTILFRQPGFSSTTSSFLDSAETNSTTVEDIFPEGNPSSKTLLANWAFASGATDPWVRLTTFNTATLGNPTVNLNGRIRFDIYSDKSLKLALGMRETGTAVGVGANGGTIGTIEWLGVASVSGNSPNPSRTIDAGNWTTVEFDFSSETVTAFPGSGDGILTGEKGVLEHLVLVPNGGSGVYNVYLDDFQFVSGASNLVVDTGETLSFNTSATDSDFPAQNLTFSLDPGAPDGAEIDPGSGTVTWTPTPAQSPSTNIFTVRVTDDGPGELSDADDVTIIVNKVNTAPRLGVFPQQVIEPGETVELIATAEDDDVPDDTLTFSLVGTIPSGATIDASSGEFNWTPPSESGEHTITIRVTDDGVPPLFDEKEITIVVSPPNAAPVLAAISDQAVVEGSVLSFTVSATDADVPAQLLAFGLDADSPEGASIDSETGAFSWTPGGTDVGTNYITVIVEDAPENGANPKSDSITFAVVVTGFAPNISAQPQSQTVNVGSGVTFSVTATGTMPLTYQWRKGGVDISGATQSSYTKSNLQTGDSGNYSVVVSNIVSSAASSDAVLIVQNPPGLSTHPQSQTVNAGANVTFTVAATGGAPLSYQWRFNGVNISGATTTSLARNNVQGANVGVYSVQVSNAVGSIISADASLSLNSRIIFSENFESGNLNNWTVHPGQDALAISTAQKHGGTYSALQDNSSNKMYRVIVSDNGGAEINGRFKMTFWMYDDNVANRRKLADIRGYSGAYNVGLQQLFAAGMYNTASVPPFETHIETNWHGRVLAGTSAGFFNLNGNGANNAQLRRTNGWQKFEIERLANGTTVNIYVDGVLGRTITGASNFSMDSITIGVGAGNTNDVAYFDDITLEIFDSPSITTQPSSQTVNAGANVTFSVAASGAASYQWRKNGVNISGATSSSLALNNVQAVNAGIYSVAILNQVGAMVSANATLTVNVPPSITAHPQSQTVNGGGNVTFNVSATGSGPLAYQWKKNGGNISGATESAYSIEGVELEDAGDYSVIVTNMAGNVASLNASLAINSAPTITAQPQPQGAIAGGTATFGVGVSGTGPFSYQWKFDGEEIPGATENSFVVTDVAPSNAGNYSVVVSNSAGIATSANAALVIYVAPSITTQPQSQTVPSEANVTFTISAAGSAPLHFQWSRNGIEIPGATLNSYSLENVQPSDAGDYSVTITNMAGSSTSDLATLTVNAAPIVVEQPQDQTLPLGADVEFSAVVTGTGPLVYQWKLNGTNISGATESSYSRTNIQAVDAGDYSLFITNEFGETTSSNAILVVEISPSISTQPQNKTVSQGGSATFSVVASGSLPLIYHWRLDGEIIYSGTSSALNLSGVQSGDQGEYSVIVSNSAGAVESSNALLVVVADSNAPQVSITSPPLNFRAPSSNVLLSGSAKDDVAVAQIFYQINNGGFQPASMSAVSNKVTWSAPLTLLPGTNIVMAKGFDLAGNESLLTAPRVIFHVVKDTITVLTNGTGGIAGSLNGQELEIGRGYSMKAFVGAGTNYIFTNWTDGSSAEVSTDLTYKFLMQPDLVLRANFIPNPFTPVAGVYAGLFHEADEMLHHSAGFFTVKVTEKAGFSCKLIFDGDSISGSGKFNLSGQGSRIISRAKKGKADVTVFLELDWSSGSQKINGTLTDGNWTAVLSGDKATFNLANPATDFVGKYTFLVPRTNFPAQAPGGFGYGLVTNSSLGKVKFSGGGLGDGTKIQQSVTLSKFGEWPLYVPLYKTTNWVTNLTTGIPWENKANYRGSLMGWVTFTNQSPSGAVIWIKTAAAATNYLYPAGFTNTVNLIGSPYSMPAAGTRMLDIVTGTITFADGNLSDPLSWNVNWASNNTVTTAVAPKPTFILSPKNGLFKGTFPHPTKGSVPYAGAVLQNLNYVGGYFIGTYQSGSVMLNGN